jgi:hypothetical protein
VKPPKLDPEYEEGAWAVFLFLVVVAAALALVFVKAILG